MFGTQEINSATRQNPAVSKARLLSQGPGRSRRGLRRNLTRCQRNAFTSLVLPSMPVSAAAFL